jgi:hypothetical protein
MGTEGTPEEPLSEEQVLAAYHSARRLGLEGVWDEVMGEPTGEPTQEELRTAEAIAGHLRAQKVLKGEFSSSERLIEAVERCYSSPGLESVRDEVTAFARQCHASGEDVVEVLVGLLDQVSREIADARDRGELVRVDDGWYLNERLTAALNLAQVRPLGRVGVKV